MFLALLKFARIANAALLLGRQTAYQVVCYVGSFLKPAYGTDTRLPPALLGSGGFTVYRGLVITAGGHAHSNYEGISNSNTTTALPPSGGRAAKLMLTTHCWGAALPSHPGAVPGSLYRSAYRNHYYCKYQMRWICCQQKIPPHTR